MDWCKREAERFKTIYKDLPWYKEGVLKPIENHYAHISNEDKSLIAFTENADKGARDIQTKIKPGKYLKKYYPNLSDATIRDLAMKIEKDGLNVFFAVTPDEIEDVYLKGPKSCMSEKATAYSSSMHPVRVYGNSDVQVAYLKNKGDITARALVWPEKKHIGRIYGDAERLTTELAKLGYRRHKIHGAKINAILDKKNNKYILPYIDETDGVSLSKDKAHIVIGGEHDRKLFPANNTSGHAPFTVCMKCEEVETRFSRVEDKEEMWCNACLTKHAFKCNGAGKYYSNEQEKFDVYFDKDSIQSVSKDYYDNHTKMCDFTNKRYISSLVMNLGDDRNICCLYFTSNGYFDEYGRPMLEAA